MEFVNIVRSTREDSQRTVLALSDMTTRTTFTLDESLAEQARRLGINVSAAARDGVASAVRAALAQADRAAYEQHPEQPDPFWADAEAWSEM
jgi:post-segregation antitoxin (ccd killing protein)